MSNFVFAACSMIANNSSTVAEVLDTAANATGNPLLTAASYAVKLAPVAFAMYAGYKTVQAVRDYTAESPTGLPTVENEGQEEERQGNVDAREQVVQNANLPASPNPRNDDDRDSFFSADEEKSVQGDIEEQEEESDDDLFEYATEGNTAPNLKALPAVHQVEKSPAGVLREVKTENNLEMAFKEMGDAYRASHPATVKAPVEQVKPSVQQVVFARAPLMQAQVPAGYSAQVMRTVIGPVYVYRPALIRPFVTTLRSADNVAYKTAYAPLLYTAPMMQRVVPLRMQAVY